MSNVTFEWKQKAEIDYFAPFILLWLSFNAWYRSHYCELAEKSDRILINKVKEDTASGRNPIYRNLKNHLENNYKLAQYFKHDLEMFHKALKGASLKPQKIIYLSLDKALVQYSDIKKDCSYIDLTIPVKSRKSKIKISDDFALIEDKELIFKGLIETIYQFRHLLIHGHVTPNKETLDVAEYAYKVLKALMPDN
ncbi:MAG: hypothetical protein HEQ32_04705 [Vampirovibrio sp.]